VSVISVKDVEKKFKVYYDKGQTFKERLLFRNRNHYEERLVLKGISFQVEKGQAIGLIGENGSGKSTLLKLITRIMYPDKGSIEIKGRVSSLIELGAGFHPDMSGRENIYTNASIFGLTKKEIDSRLNDIIAFSELEEFIDNPVRTYSSGMYMRLAFSVAINVDADILLIDEILAVGDVNFQAKCFNKLRDIKAKGATIIIVSHSLSQIEQICDKSIWIDQGVIRKIDKPREVHPMYLDYMGSKSRENKEEIGFDTTNAGTEDMEQIPAVDQTPAIDENALKKRWGNKDAEIVSIKLLDNSGREKYVFKSGEQMDVVIQYKVNKTVPKPNIGVGIVRNDEVNCYGTNTKIDGIEVDELTKDGHIIFRVCKSNLLAGEYMLDVAIETQDGFACDFIRDALRFRVYSEINDIGTIRLDHQWIFK
jgi:ABC-type polysaccharide/polyol phosphate transport system ATPase subunit